MDAKTLIIDRIEEGIAVCEDAARGMVEVALDALPEGAREGSVLKDAGSEGWQLDAEAAQEIKQRIAQKMDALFK